METESAHTLLSSFEALPPGRYRPFATVAVLGAGTMGSQIAAHCANAGLQVILLDIAAKEGPRNSVVEKQFQQAAKLRPDPFFDENSKKRVQLGNFDDDFERVALADWIIEVVVERIDIKRQVMERVEEHARPDAVISTNTSGLPIAQIAEGRSASFRSRFLGTHFFNPPRYLKLLELVPTDDTDPVVLARVAEFGRVHLGKGIVVAKDRPYFIGNRVGIYGMLSAIRQFTEGDYSIEEIDTLTGPLTGRPNSGTFRTADVVGLDVMKHVIDNLREAVPDDESVAAFAVPPVLGALVDNGALGAKTKAGFYRKEGEQIKSIDPTSGTYVEARVQNLGDLAAIKALPGLTERLRALFADDGRAGAFFRTTTLDLLGYAARRVPEIADSPADIDRAIRWGFGWEAGPFEIWDALGFDTVNRALDDAEIAYPAWIEVMRKSGQPSFYKSEGGQTNVYVPDVGRYVADPPNGDEIQLAPIRARADGTVWKNGQAALLDIGDDVVLFEFRSKANTLGQEVMEGLRECIERVEADPDLRGMVIGNEGANFSVGANLAEAAMALAAGQFKVIDKYVGRFQDTIQRIRYASKPVVVAAHQRVLGGACEMVMACPNPVVSAETYIGLVELGVGLIPAGTGSMRMAANASESAPNGRDSEIRAALTKSFNTVAMASVATSATQGIDMGFIPPSSRVVMNAERRFFVARSQVIALSDQGYLPPPVKTHIRVLGRDAYAAMKAGVFQYLQGRFVSEYDYRLAQDFAYVLSGGDLTGSQEVHEDYLLDLEREVFLRLVGEPKTQERIKHLLSTNKPLRN
jgi:3-hydroxyacyl-CoA dehydrogenase